MKYLKARRGQAFETMMLVISVIVALAILAVLLNILNIVKIFNPSSPKDVMSSGLKEIQSKGYGITSPSKVTFTKDAIITRGELISDIPIRAEQVRFFCEGAALCGAAPKPIDAPGNTKLEMHANIAVFVVTCGKDTDGGKYCIAIGATGKEATDKCISTSACDIQ